MLNSYPLAYFPIRFVMMHENNASTQMHACTNMKEHTYSHADRKFLYVLFADTDPHVPIYACTFMCVHARTLILLGK